MSRTPNESCSNLDASATPQTNPIEGVRLRANLSSDCIGNAAIYDSDGPGWTQSQTSSGSNINFIQGSATRLDQHHHQSGSQRGELVRSASANSNNIDNESSVAKIMSNQGDDVQDCGIPGFPSDVPDQMMRQSFHIGDPTDQPQDDEFFYLASQASHHDQSLEMQRQMVSRHRLDQQRHYLHHHHHHPFRQHQFDADSDEDQYPQHVRLNEGDVDLDDEDDQEYDPHKQVIVGICAMEKKAQSKPMNEILKRLEDYFEYIKPLVFDEKVILDKPIEEWPLCDCLISFHSKGFPLSKAIEYARLRRPFLVNDLDIQYDIQDRRKVYKILEEADIELPRYAVLDRDSANPEDRELVESDDHIEVANFIFNKPFVEKPISAEDHNICIYYPAHAGGGSQRLFRKIGCRSSVYSNESHVRKTGSYIYEEFMPTDGTDVKVYTAGPDYAHAEARKSPALDGKVERDSDGKEIRYPVILTNREKLIARKVCMAFKQTVCGFDLLRANGRSYVCDVNGFSFVKSSMKYYEDCSKILGNMMLRALAFQLHIPWSIPFQLDDPPIVPTTFGRMMELRCVIAVIRHGDRTPKQKMKLEVKHQKFFDLYHKYGKNGQAKLKKPKQLQEVLDIARYLLGELPDQPLTSEVVEPRVKLRQLKSVLEMYGHFSGINRKVQLKYQPNGRPRRSSSEDESTREPSLVLILKWGGELTPAGRVQAEDLGRCFRRLYPASGDYSGPQGLGLLRLHSTFRHDLKIYASDEGRVQMTAAAFAKGFLALEGELTPILFQMVKSANTNGLLDNDCESSKCQKIVKDRLHEIMQKNQDLSAEDIEILNPTQAPSIQAAIKFIGNPHQACEKVHKLIKELNTLIKSKRQDNCFTQEYHLYHGETWDLLQRRWAKLEKDFKFPRSKRFDISKIPDIYDCIKYDLQHNQHTLQFSFAHELHTYAKALADIVIPQEYGITADEKLMIGLGTCSPLLRKIQADLLHNAESNEDETENVNRLDPKYSHGVSSPDRHVRTRLYFTSESHIHSLVTSLQFGGLLDVKKDEQWKRSMEFLSAISELNYLSQIVIMLYEDPTKEPTSDDRFHVEIHFSSGVINRIHQKNIATEPQGPGFRPHLHNKSYSNASSASGSGQKGSDSAPATASILANSSSPLSETSSGIASANAALITGSSESPVSMRLKLGGGSTMNQGQESMIKEEPTDEERSTDGDSRNNSKGSSICLTPNKSSKAEVGVPSQTTAEKPSKPKSPILVAMKSHTKSSSASTVDEESTETGDDQSTSNNTLTQDEAGQLSIQASSSTPSASSDLSQTARGVLARSYSAITPMSLQDLFRRTPIEPKYKSLSRNDQSPIVCPLDDASSEKKMRDSQPGTGHPSQVDSDDVKDDSSKENSQDQNSTLIKEGSSPRPRAASEAATILASAKLSASDKSRKELQANDQLNATPHLLHRYQQTRRRYQIDSQQQIINLPPTYHTIHHCNFSPSILNSRLASVSMSTSPQQPGGVGGLQQRYLAHKQQQQQQVFLQSGGKLSHQLYPHSFTLSASMPIQYKSGSNPRACSVADVSQFCGGPSSLISTAVISGSSPELVAVCPYSPTIRPLETLHNELSLKQFIEFIVRLTRSQRLSTAHPSDHKQLAHHHHHHHRHHPHSALRSRPNDLNLASTTSSSATTSDANGRQESSEGLNNNLNSGLGSLLTRPPGTGGAQSDTPGGATSTRNLGGVHPGKPIGLSPGNSLSNSLIWSGPPSSFASSPGPSSPSAAFELWSKLELDEPGSSGDNSGSGNNL